MLEVIITSSVLILAILIIKALFGKNLSRRANYCLWFLAAVRLVLPFSVSSPFSIMTILDIPSVQNVTATVNAKASSQEIVLNGANFAEQGFAMPLLTPAAFVTIIWLTVTALLFLWFLFVNIGFYAKLKKSRRLANYDCKLKVYIADGLASPCLAGVFKPCIYVTQQVFENKQDLKNVIAHELCHYKQLDHIWSILRLALVSVHWYNPLVWLAANISKDDCELCCDEAAIKMLGAQQKTQYGDTLLRLADNSCVKSFAASATTMSCGSRSIKKRILILAIGKKNLVWATAASVLLLAVAAGITFTGAAMNAQQAAESLITSLKTSSDKVYFTIPSNYNAKDYNIFIYGTAPMDSGNMSVHLFENENISGSWQRGKTYEIDMSEGNYTDLSMEVYMLSDKNVYNTVNLKKFFEDNKSYYYRF